MLFSLPEDADGNVFNYLGMFAPYLLMLPESLPTMPHNFTAKEMEMLKGTQAEAHLSEIKEKMEQDFDMICEHVEEFKDFAPEQFFNCFALAFSRS